MCDTMVSLTDDGVLFAKNSDRDPNEAQIVEWHAAQDHPPNASVPATWIQIPQVSHTHAVLISRPWWMWGAEMGTNSHGVTIGNEAVFTRSATSGEPGLLGMDLLRLALERASTAEAAVEVIVTLLQRHGQAGSCSHAHPRFTYHNSFLVADPRSAIVLETAGRQWAVEQVTGAGRAISNGLTIPGFARHHSDRIRTRIGAAVTRRAITEQRCALARTPADLMGTLRANSSDTNQSVTPPRWSPINGSMRGPNMHAGGLLTSSQTVASWVSDLRPGGRHWVTATADPALSLFKPLSVDSPTDFGPDPTDTYDPSTLWWRHEVLHRKALRDWATALAVIQSPREEIESGWLSGPPTTAEALTIADDAEHTWLQAITQRCTTETRPRWLQHQWRRYNKAAQIPQEECAA